MGDMVLRLRQSAAHERRRATAALQRDAADRLVILYGLQAGYSQDAVVALLVASWGDSNGGYERAVTMVQGVVELVAQEEVLDDPSLMHYERPSTDNNICPGVVAHLSFRAV